MDKHYNEIDIKNEKREYNIEEIYIKERDPLDTNQDEETLHKKMCYLQKLNLFEAKKESEYAPNEKISQETSGIPVNPKVEKDPPNDIHCEAVVKTEEYIIEKEVFVGKVDSSCLTDYEKEYNKTKSLAKKLSSTNKQNVKLSKQEGKKGKSGCGSLALQLYLKRQRRAKSLKCDICGYATNYITTLKNHSRIHSGEKPYKCHICSYSACQKGQLNTHLKIHSEANIANLFKCNLCSYTGAHRSHLERHFRIHSGEKPFKCNNCNFATACKSNLIEHLKRKHSGEKPYRCTSCSYASASEMDLKRHLRSHTGLKPFKCDNCSYATCHKSHYVRHLIVHRTEKPYKCTLCSYAATCKKYLSNHVRIHDKV